MTCRRCGLCCHIRTGGGKLTRCRHLAMKNGKGICRIWGKRDRIGTPTGYKNNTCHRRADSLFDYEGCPYNTGTKPVIHWDGSVTEAPLLRASPELERFRRSVSGVKEARIGA